MKLRLFNAVCYLALLAAVAPGTALAQKGKPSTCPSTNQVTINLDGLAKLPALAELNKISELADMSNLTPELNEADQGLEAVQSCEAAYVNQDTEAAAYDAEKRKAFEKTYKVNSSDALSIQNKFGQVKVNTWNKSEIQVKVDIIARCVSDAKAQEMLDKINIVDSREGNTISVVTKTEPMRVSGNHNRSFEINYTIYMPESNSLAVKNSFGDVYLASLKGKTDVNVSYGALKTERLSNSDNKVKVTYGSGNCGYINGGSVNLAYADVFVGGANGLKGNASYGNFKIGQLTEEMDINFKHGTFKVDNVSKNIKKINLDSNYGSVSLNFDDNTSFNFDVNVQFGEFKVDRSLVNLTTLEKGYTSAEYKGRFGGASPKGIVNITSKFGDVKFTK